VQNGAGIIVRIILAPFFLFLALSPACAAGVTVKTATDTCKAGQPVAIVLTNGSGESIYSLAKSDSPGRAVRNLEIKNPRGIWDAFFLKSRKGNDADFERAGELKPGESATFSWTPLVLEGGRELPAAPGRYRITVIYHASQGPSRVFGTAKSNEFTIE